MSYIDTVSSYDIQSEKMKNNKMRQLKNIKGFTLVELIVVLLIVAILAAIAVPTFLAFMDRAKEKDYETNAAKCLASTQAALSEIFSDASNSFSIKKRESVRDLCDSEKKSTEFIVWTKSSLDSKSVRALPEYIASYTIEKALYEEAGCYLAYDGEKWKVFNSNKAREEALAFLSPDNDKAIYMWPYKQDLAYYPEIGEGGGNVADDSDTVRVVNLNLDTTCLNYVYYAPKGSDGNSGLKTMKVIFWKDSAGTVQSTWTTEGGKQYFSYDDSTVYELHEERYPVEGWVLEDGSGKQCNGRAEVEAHIYGDGETAKTYDFKIKLGAGANYTVDEVYVSKAAFSSALASFPSNIKGVYVATTEYSTEKDIPQRAVRIDDTSVKDGFVFAWDDGTTFVWWTNARTVYMPADCSSMFKSKNKVVKFDFAGLDFSKVTNMSEMFADNSSLTDITGISGCSAVTNTSGMFRSCTSLDNAEVSGLSGNISKLNGMFEGCSNISSITFADDFSTTSATDYKNVFKGCEKLRSISISGFDFSSAQNLDSMFEGCSTIEAIEPGNWSLMNVTSMNATFKGCNNLTTLNTASMATSRKLNNLEETFAGCYSLTTIDLSRVNAGAVTSTKKMFSMEEWKNTDAYKNNCSLKTITFGAPFDTSNVKDMSGMFEYCHTLESINGMDNLRSTKVTDMSYMFANTYNLKELKLTSFDTSSVDKCKGMFFYDNGNSKLTKVYVSSKFVISEKNEKVFSSNEAYNKLQGGRKTDAPTVKAIDSTGYDSALYACADGWGGKKGYFIGDYTKAYVDKTKFQALFTTDTDSIVRIDTSNYTLSEIQYMDGITDIRDSKKTTTHYIFAWREGNNIKWWSDAEEVHLPDDCGNLFKNNAHIKSFSFVGFDVSNVSTFNSTFMNCSNLQSVTFGNSFYTDSLTNTKNMFNGCSIIEEIDVSGWNMKRVPSSNYQYMFSNCGELKKILSDGSFAVSTTNTDMFNNCSKLKGGAGTKYTDMTNPAKSVYATIDTDNIHGYFTQKP